MAAYDAVARSPNALLIAEELNKAHFSTAAPQQAHSLAASFWQCGEGEGR